MKNRYSSIADFPSIFVFVVLGFLLGGPTLSLAADLDVPAGDTSISTTQENYGNVTLQTGANLTISDAGSVFVTGTIATDASASDTHLNIISTSDNPGVKLNLTNGGASSLDGTNININVATNATASSCGISLSGSSLQIANAQLRATLTGSLDTSVDTNAIYAYSGTLDIEHTDIFTDIGGGGRNWGMALYNESVLNIDNSTLTNNVAGIGNYAGDFQIAVAIYGSNSEVNITNSTVYNNITSGGGIGVELGGTINIIDSTFTNNVNGGTYNFDTGFGINEGAINITNSTLTNNVTGGNGIFNGFGDLTISESSVTSTTSGGNGIYNHANLTVSNSTLNLNGTGVEIYNEGLTTISDGAHVTLGADAVIMNAGPFDRNESSIIVDNATLVIDGMISGVTSSIALINNARLTGTGTINDWTYTRSSGANVQIAPGSNNGADVGTLTLVGNHSWSNTTYEWTFANLGIGAGDTIYSGNDLVDVNGYFWFGAYGISMLNILPDASLDTAGLLADLGANGGIKSYALITANNGFLFFNDLDTDVGILNKDSALAALGLTGQVDLNLVLGDSDHTLLLQLSLLTVEQYIWRENTTGLWSESAKWESAPGFSAAGKDIFFTRNQSAGNGSVTVDQATATVGNLTIGSDVGNHTISGNTIAFDGDSGSSTLTHAANAQAGDTIASNINIAANDLTIDALSDNALLFTGAFSGGKNLTLTGTGKLDFQTQGIDVGNITIRDSVTANLLNTGSDFGIENWFTLLVRDTATLNVTNSGTGFGIYNVGDLNLANDATLNSRHSGSANSGINNSGTIILFDSSTLNSINSDGTGIHNDGSITLNDSSTLNSANSGDSFGVYSNNAIYLNDSATLNSTNSGDGYGIYTLETFTTSGDKVTLNSTNTGDGIGFYNAGNFTNTGNLAINLSGDRAFVNEASNSGYAALTNEGDLTIAGDGTFLNTATGGNGIDNTGTLIIDGAAFDNNASSYASGIYADGENASIEIKNGSTFTSTVNSAYGIDLLNGATLSIADSTFTNNVLYNGTGNSHGIYSRNSDITITNSTLTQNIGNSITDLNTRGIYMMEGNISITDSIFTQTVTGGSGTEGIEVYTGNITITNTTFTQTVNGNGAYIGGDIDMTLGILISEGELVIEGGTFVNNVSGGVGIGSDRSSNFHIRNATLHNNYTGGIYDLDLGLGIIGGNINISNTTFTNNANSINGAGNAIYFAGGNLNITDGGSFLNNVTSGRGIYIDSGATLNIADTTFTQEITNSVGIYAGGCSTSSSINITNTTLTQNISNGTGIRGISDGGSITISDSHFTQTTSDNSIALEFNYLDINGGTFVNNVAGFAVGIINQSIGSLNITDADFYNNYSGTTGTGGVEFSAGMALGATSALISGGNFTNNANGAFSAIYVPGTSIEINSSNFTNNVTSGNGILVSTEHAGGDLGSASLNITDTNFTQTVTGTGTGILVTGNASLNITNTTLTHTTTYPEEEGAPKGAGISTTDDATLDITDTTFVSTETNIGDYAGVINHSSDGTFSITNSTLVLKGESTMDAKGGVYSKANIDIGDNTRLLVDTAFSTEGTINITGDNVLIAGNGLYGPNVTGGIAFTGVSSTTRFSPGGTYNADGTITHTTGHLLVIGDANFGGFTYDWQMGSFSDNSASFVGATANDWLAFGKGNLTFSGAASDYTFNLGTLGDITATVGTPVAKTWSLLSAWTGDDAHPFSFTGIDAAFLAALNTSHSTTFDNLLASLGLTGQGSFSFNFIDETIGGSDFQSLVLVFDPLTGQYIWRENTNGLWSTAANWESNPTFNAAGKDIYFTRNQSAGNGTVTVDAETATVGNLTIGSDIGFHIISGNSITFDGAGNSSLLLHAANAQAGDTITSNLTLNNDLTIEALSANTLLFTGSFSGGKNLTLTGTGNLDFQTQGIDLGNITIQDSVTANLLNTGSGFGIENWFTILIRDTATLNVTTSDSGPGIHNTGDITLNNNATLNSTSSNYSYGITNYGAITLNDNSTLNPTATDSAYGIFNSGDITLNNNSTLNSTDSAYGIFNDGTITLNNNSTLNSTTSRTAHATGIDNDGGAITLNDNSTLNIISIGTGTGYGLYNHSEITLNENATLTITGDSASTGLNNDEGAISLNGNATLTLNNTTATSTYSGTDNAIYIGTNANVLITDGATLESTYSNSRWDASGIYNAGNFTIKDGATLKNNKDGSGYGIHNIGNFTIKDGATLENNNDGNGDGILNNGNFSITGSTFINNASGSSYGYGITNNGTFSITDSTFTNNASGTSRAVNNDGTFSITNSTFTQNVSNSAIGIYHYLNNGINITGSTFTQNVSDSGNGIYINANNTNVSNSTLATTVSGTGTGIRAYGSGCGTITFNITDNSTLLVTNTGSGNGISFGGAAATINVDNSTLVLNGTGTGITTYDGATLAIGQGTRILNDSRIDSTTAIQASAANTILAGSGTYNATLTGIDSRSTRIQAGGAYNATTKAIDAKAGILTFTPAQAFGNFTYDWTLGNGTQGATDNSRLHFADTLSLTGSDYSLNLLNASTGLSNTAIGTTYTWTLISTANGLSLGSTDDWSLSNQNAFLTSLGISTTSALTFSADANNLYLTLQILAQQYIWRENTNGLWSQGLAVWEADPTFNAAGKDIFFTRNQSAGNGSVTIDQGVATVGNITIGSDVGNHVISGNSIAFDGAGGSSTLTHAANAQAGDTITSNFIIDANDLLIRGDSTNPLILNGTMSTATNKNATLTGNITLNTNTLSGTEARNIALKNLIITGANITHNHDKSGNGIYIGSSSNLWITDSSNFTQTVTDGYGIYSAAGNVTIDGASTLNLTNIGSSGIHNSNGTFLLTDGSILTSINESSGWSGLYNLHAGLTDKAFTVSNATLNSFNYGTHGIANYGNFIVTDGSTLNSTATIGNGIFQDAGTSFTVNGGSTLNLNSSDSATGFYNYGACSTATLNVSGIDTTFNSINNGTGNGIRNTNRGSITIADGAKLSNTYNGSTWNAQGIYNAGTITVRDGATLENTLNGTNSQAFYNNTGALLTVSNATLNATVSNSGTGIYNFGTLTVGNNSTLNVLNTGTGYAGIYSSGGNLIIENSTLNIESDATNSNGNGIQSYTNSGNEFRISGSTVNATNTGAGSTIGSCSTITINNGTTFDAITAGTGNIIHMQWGDLNITNSTLNLTNTGTGTNINTPQAINLANSTLTNNVSSTGTGILMIGESNLTLSGNSTLTNNATDSSTGIYFADSDTYSYLSLANSTLNTTATGSSTGIYIGRQKTLHLSADAGSTFNVTSSDTANGILNNGGNLFIDGGSTLNITNTGAGNGIYNTYGSQFEINEDNAVLNVTNSGSGNGIYNAFDNGSYASIYNTANLTINVTNTGSGVGIYNEGNFTNQGNLTLNLSGDRAFVNEATNGYSSLDNFGGLTINGGTAINNTTDGSGINNYGAIILNNNTLDSTASASVTGIYSYGSITLNNSTLNSTTYDFAYGIYNAGNLILNNSTLNSTNEGGGYGLYNDSGNLILNGNSTLNSASTDYSSDIHSYGTITLNDNSTLNSTNTGYGNGIYTQGNFTLNDHSTLNITNDGAAYDSHGLYNDGSTLTLNGNSTLLNTSSGSGNGIYNSYGTIILNDHAKLTTNATSGNGIYNYDGTITLNDSANLTVTGDRAATGLHNEGTITLNDSSTLTLNNTTATNTGWIEAKGSSNITITDTTFTNNEDGGQNSLYIIETATLNIANSTVTQDVTNGSGIYNENQVVISNTTFNASVSATGMGIYNDHGTITIANGSTFNTTSTSASGAGLYNDGGNISVTDSTLINTVLSSIGSPGIVNTGNFNISNSTVTQDVTLGTGISNSGLMTVTGGSFNNNQDSSTAILNTGTLTLNGALTFINNTTVDGQGIYNDTAGTLEIKDGVTFVNNSTDGTNIGIFNDGGTINIVNSTLISTNSGIALLNENGIVNLGENTRLYHNAGIIESSNALNVTGNNVTIAGAGTINAAITGLGGKYGTALGTNANTTFSPGVFNTATGLSEIGTLTLGASQTWTNGFNIDWQMGSTTQNLGFNDLLKITGTLTLDSNYDNFDLAYLIRMSGLNLDSSSTAPTNGMYWTVIQADSILNFNPLLWNDSVDFRNSANDLIAALGLTGQGRFSITGNSTEIGITYQAVTAFVWNSTLSGDWMTSGNWENNWAPDISTVPDADVYLIRNQTASTGNINLGGETITIGSLTIGSENITATDTHYFVHNGTLAFKDSSGTSELTHSNFAQGDEIAADIVLENQLGIITTANGTLTLSGNITGTDSQLAVFGDGVAVIKGTNSNLGSARFDVMESGASLLFDGATLRTTGMTTVVGGAMIGGHGTLAGNITFEHGSFLTFKGRSGAKYTDRFNITGTTTFQGGASFINLANLSAIASTDAATGSSRAITTEMNYISASVFNLNAAATYTLNLYNEGTYDITDWTKVQDNNGIYYALVLSDNINGFDGTTWNINLMDASGNLWTGGGIWEIIKGEQGGMHGIWLHYTNPNRIPEPSTYAALIAALALVATFIAKRRKK